MDNIINFYDKAEKATEASKDDKDMIDFVINIPNNVFDKMYPTLKSELLKAAENGELRESFANGISKEQKETSLGQVKDLQNILEDEETKKALGKSKIEYLKLYSEFLISAINDAPFHNSVNVKLHCDSPYPPKADENKPTVLVFATDKLLLAKGESAVADCRFSVELPAGWQLRVTPLLPGITFLNGGMETFITEEDNGKNIQFTIVNCGDKWEIEEGSPLFSMTLCNLPFISFFQ